MIFPSFWGVFRGGQAFFDSFGVKINVYTGATIHPNFILFFFFLLLFDIFFLFILFLIFSSYLSSYSSPFIFKLFIVFIADIHI